MSISSKRIGKYAKRVLKVGTKFTDILEILDELGYEDSGLDWGKYSTREKLQTRKKEWSVEEENGRVWHLAFVGEHHEVCEMFFNNQNRLIDIQINIPGMIGVTKFDDCLTILRDIFLDRDVDIELTGGDYPPF